MAPTDTSVPVRPAELLLAYGDRLLAPGRNVWDIMRFCERLEACRQVLALADIVKDCGCESFSLVFDPEAYDRVSEPSAGGLFVRLEWKGCTLDIAPDDGYAETAAPPGWDAARGNWEDVCDDLSEQLGEFLRSEVTEEEGANLRQWCGEKRFPPAIHRDAVLRAILDPETMAEFDALRLASQPAASIRPRRRG